MVYFLDLVLVVGNIGQNGKRLHFMILFSTITYVVKVLLNYKLGYFCNQGPGVETMIDSASKLWSPEVTAKLRPCCLCSPLAEMSPISLEQPSDLDGIPRVERLP